MKISNTDYVYIVRKVVDGTFGSIVDIYHKKEEAEELAKWCDRGYPGIVFSVQRYQVH